MWLWGNFRQNVFAIFFLFCHVLVCWSREKSTFLSWAVIQIFAYGFADLLISRWINKCLYEHKSKPASWQIHSLNIPPSAPCIQSSPLHFTRLQMCFGKSLFDRTKENSLSPLWQIQRNARKLDALTVCDNPIPLIPEETVTPHPLINLSTKQSKQSRSHSPLRQKFHKLNPCKLDWP